MELKNNKILISTIVVVLVVLVSYNFESLTGQATIEKPTEITITSGISEGTIYSRTNVEFLLENSRPAQRIEVDEVDGSATRYYLEAKNCKPYKSGSSEYKCTASQRFASEDLVDGQRYCFQAKDRYGNDEGKLQACFKFEEI